MTCPLEVVKTRLQVILFEAYNNLRYLSCLALGQQFWLFLQLGKQLKLNSESKYPANDLTDTGGYMTALASALPPKHSL